jgi:AbrB family looped-hinge helix DNA binding protein
MSHKAEQSFEVNLGDRGRLVLPSQVRQECDLKAGDKLILTVLKDGTLLLHSLRDQVKKVRGLYKRASGKRSIVDELIQERRQEAKSEGRKRGE